MNGWVNIFMVTNLQDLTRLLELNCEIFNLLIKLNYLKLYFVCYIGKLKKKKRASKDAVLKIFQIVNYE